jgi:hypothetical protein
VRGVRRRIRRFAGTWLLLQFLVTIWIPVALHASTSSEHAVEECTCDHPDGGVCPMHKHSMPSRSTSTECSLRSPFDPLDALVGSLLGTAGVLPHVVMTIAPIESNQGPSRPDARPLDRLVPPDSPPPRA